VGIFRVGTFLIKAFFSPHVLHWQGSNRQMSSRQGSNGALLTWRLPYAAEQKILLPQW
jgi:hypothetical protein